MKKLIVFISIAILFRTFGVSALPIDGLYLNDTTGMLIKVQKDTLQIYNLFLGYTESWDDAWANPQAKCIMKSVGQDIASINSIHPNFLDTMFEDIVINIENDDTDQFGDSTEIIFRFPSLDYTEVDIEVFMYWGEELKSRTEFGQCKFKEKRAEEHFDFTISPVGYIPFGNYNQYLGALYKRYRRKIKTDYKTKRITIEIPNVDDYTFTHYVVEDGFISYTANDIKWRDLVFVRLTDRQIPEFTFAYEVWWANHLMMHNRFNWVTVPYYNINTP